MADNARSLIARVLVAGGELSQAIDRGIMPEMMPDALSKEAWAFILDFNQKYAAVPSMELFEEKFPNLFLDHAKEPALYYSDKVIEQYVRNTAAKLLLSSAKPILADPLGGLAALRSAVNALALEANPSTDVDLSQNMVDRITSYMRLKEVKGVDGLPTPWKSLNEATGGWHPEDFCVVGARPGAGKSWMLVILAEYLWNLGFKPLFITKEMSTEQIGRRFDAVHYKLPYKEFRAGLLPDALEQKYLEQLSAPPDKSPMIVVGQEVMTVSGLRAKIEQYQPDIVFLDGLYLMQDEKGGESQWMRMTNISRACKETAQIYKIPIIATTQLNRAGEVGKGRTSDDITLAAIGYSDAIGQDADVVLGLIRTKDMALCNELRIKPLKVREAAMDEIVLEWDLHGMRFTDRTPSLEDFSIDSEDESLDF